MNTNVSDDTDRFCVLWWNLWANLVKGSFSSLFQEKKLLHRHMSADTADSVHIKTQNMIICGCMLHGSPLCAECYHICPNKKSLDCTFSHQPHQILIWGICVGLAAAGCLNNYMLLWFLFHKSSLPFAELEVTNATSHEQTHIGH